MARLTWPRRAESDDSIYDSARAGSTDAPYDGPTLSRLPRLSVGPLPAASSL